MQKKNIAVLVLLVFFFSVNNCFSINYNLANEKLNLLDVFSIPKMSIAQSPIKLEGNMQLDSFPNKTGGGIWGDPYIIEDLEINGGFNKKGIEIKNTDRYLIIKNCHLFNCSIGIVIRDCINITLFENNVSKNEEGIYLMGSYNNISENIISYNNMHGISISGSNNLIFRNVISNNNQSGIRLSDSNDNNLSRNTILFNQNGISLGSSNGNTLSGNNISNQSEGISLYYSNSNTLSGNIISYHTTGISVYYSNSSTLSGNTISYNLREGIRLYDSWENKIFENNISFNIYYGIFIQLSYNNEIYRNILYSNDKGNIGYIEYLYIIIFFDQSFLRNNIYDNDGLDTTFLYFFVIILYWVIALFPIFFIIWFKIKKWDDIKVEKEILLDKIKYKLKLCKYGYIILSIGYYFPLLNYIIFHPSDLITFFFTLIATSIVSCPLLIVRIYNVNKRIKYGWEINNPLINRSIITFFIIFIHFIIYYIMFLLFKPEMVLLMDLFKFNTGFTWFICSLLIIIGGLITIIGEHKIEVLIS